MYKAYAKKKDTPSRLARKGARLGVFLFNKTMARKRRKAARLERKSQRDE